MGKATRDIPTIGIYVGEYHEVRLLLIWDRADQPART